MPHREGTEALTQRSWFMKTSCGAPSTWRPARKEIEVLATGDLAVERLLPATGPKPDRPVRQCHHLDGRAGPSQHTTPEAPDEATPVLASRDGRPRPGNPAVAAPWPYRAAFLGPLLCHWSSRPRKTPCRGSGGEEPDAPLGQSAMPNGYPFSRAWGEGWDTGSTTRSDSHPHAAPRRGRLSTGASGMRKPRLSRLCWPTRGFGTLAYVWYCYPITKAPQVVRQLPALVKEVRSQIGSDSLGPLQVRQDVLGNEGQP